MTQIKFLDALLGPDGSTGSYRINPLRSVQFPVVLQLLSADTTTTASLSLSHILLQFTHYHTLPHINITSCDEK